MPEGTSGQPPAEDDLDRQLRELTEGGGGPARYREPSAAERAKAAKKQAKQARKQSKARARRDPRPSAGWRGGARHDLSVSEARKHAKRARKQAERGERRVNRRRRAQRAVSWTIAVVVLGGGAWFGYQHVRHGGSTAIGGGMNALNGTALNGVRQPTSTGPGHDPFASTPADHWANGAAGIIIPATSAHGPFTASEVAAAYATTRKLLIAANLDPTTLRGGAPTAYEDLLQKQQRQEFVAGLDKADLNTQNSRAGTRGWVASFAPGTTELIGNVIKVYGSMRAQTAVDQGRTVLRVVVDYRFVYPVEPPHKPAYWTRVIGQLSGYVEFNDWQDPGGALLPWTMTDLSVANDRCDIHDGFIHPEFTSDAPDKVRPSGAPIDPYSLQNTPSSNGCQETTGT